MKKVIFTVTNDLSYDQRMIRICTSLAEAGYRVTLVGTKNRHSPPLRDKKYSQIRLFTFFRKGPGFYAEYNFRLFCRLLFTKADIICCIDLDTMLPVWLVSVLKNTKRVYDAHEYFSEQKEVLTRPKVHFIWHWIEQKFIPKFEKGYTVSNSIATAFNKLYGVDYAVIRNIPLLKKDSYPDPVKEKAVIYQGAVNEARGLEYLIPAMRSVDATLSIYGDGNFMAQTKDLIKANNLQDKVFLKGKLLPGELDVITASAYAGINLVENNGMNQYYSLANKFFDYMHCAVPQVSMNFPEYKLINDQFEVALLIDDLKPTTIANAINKLLNDETVYHRLQQNCLKAREILNWQEEEKKLVGFYKKMMNDITGPLPMNQEPRTKNQEL